MADEIDLTFQQFQKYECGSNRISASKLYEISRVLKMPIERFFDAVEAPETDEFRDSDAGRNVHSFLMTTEGIEIAQTFPGIRKTAVRKKVLDLVRALAEGDD